MKLSPYRGQLPEAAFVAAVLLADFLMLLALPDPTVRQLGINAILGGAGVALYLDHSRADWQLKCVPDSLDLLHNVEAGIQAAA